MPAKTETLRSEQTPWGGTTSAPEPLMTAADVAKRLSVPVSWVYEKAALGIIPSIKVGVYRRFRWSQVELWLEEMNT
jgi:excisionase family DNA binding protein